MRTHSTHTPSCELPAHPEAPGGRHSQQLEDLHAAAERAVGLRAPASMLMVLQAGLTMRQSMRLGFVVVARWPSAPAWQCWRAPPPHGSHWRPRPRIPLSRLGQCGFLRHQVRGWGAEGAEVRWASGRRAAGSLFRISFRLGELSRCRRRGGAGECASTSQAGLHLPVAPAALHRIGGRLPPTSEHRPAQDL